jgi:8-oxo-dGTP pyrophosphatase MutT (NUDIX family)
MGHDGELVVTLNSDGLPPGSRNMLRIGAVGGGQEPLESILDCALREAKEELSVQQIKALPAPSTFFHDMDSDEIRLFLSEKRRYKSNGNKIK